MDLGYVAVVGQKSKRLSHLLYRQHLTVRTHAHFLAAHARTPPDVITRFAQGLDDLFVWLKSHFMIGHVFVECSFDTVSSYFLITYCLADASYCLTDATDWNQIKPCATPLWFGPSGFLADPIPNTMRLQLMVLRKMFQEDVRLVAGQWCSSIETLR